MPFHDEFDRSEAMPGEQSSFSVPDPFGTSTSPDFTATETLSPEFSFPSPYDTGGGLPTGTAPPAQGTNWGRIVSVITSGIADALKAKGGLKGTGVEDTLAGFARQDKETREEAWKQKEWGLKVAQFAQSQNKQHAEGFKDGAAHVQQTMARIRTLPTAEQPKQIKALEDSLDNYGTGGVAAKSLIPTYQIDPDAATWLPDITAALVDPRFGPGLKPAVAAFTANMGMSRGDPDKQRIAITDLKSQFAGMVAADIERDLVNETFGPMKKGMSQADLAATYERFGGPIGAIKAKVIRGEWALSERAQAAFEGAMTSKGVILGKTSVAAQHVAETERAKLGPDIIEAETRKVVTLEEAKAKVAKQYKVPETLAERLAQYELLGETGKVKAIISIKNRLDKEGERNVRERAVTALAEMRKKKKVSDKDFEVFTEDELKKIVFSSETLLEAIFSGRFGGLPAGPGTFRYDPNAGKVTPK